MASADSSQGRTSEQQSAPSAETPRAAVPSWLRPRRSPLGPWPWGGLLIVAFAAGALLATVSGWTHHQGQPKSCDLTGSPPLQLDGCDLRVADVRKANMHAANM